MNLFLGVFSSTGSYADRKAGARRLEQQPQRSLVSRGPAPPVVNRIGKFIFPAREKIRMRRILLFFFPSARLFLLI